MDKVYLLWAELWESNHLVTICKSVESAGKEKIRIGQVIEYIKTHYFSEYNSDYDIDLDFLEDDNFLLENEDAYDRITTQIYAYKAMHKELEYGEITIEEREVL